VGPQTVCFTDTNGKQLEQSAKNALVATLAYDTELSDGWRMNGELSAQYRSKRFISPDNRIWLPSITNVDAQVRFNKDNYAVTVYVTNLLDQDKVTSAQSYGDPFIAFPVSPPVLAYTTYPSDPRQFGLRLNYKF
jgi:outer membrane receptor protein involved in Fe transport